MKTALITGLSELDIQLGEADADLLCLYGQRLLEKNQVMNLTAITDPAEVAKLHFLDSLALTKYIDLKGKRLIDVGCGAGFPSLPLKIAVPELGITMLDSTEKRINWLKELTGELGVEAECIAARAEELAMDSDYRRRFDVATARAVARLNILTELCLPFVKVGGVFVAMKGADSEDEINEAKNAIKLLGGKIEAVEDYKVPGTDVIHRLVIVRKVAATPREYPRKYAKIKKSPL
ncbi:MAG: 16S rRNA (guanine(527)-N(7))-methyltransferase RsmG [Ruminococcaceae bacterium]|nr:16S rRNA (guanine(527)-N(7))-methyltransferase RsmG [Oscillospiraceae bacterium]